MIVNFENISAEKKKVYAEDIVLFAEEVFGMDGRVMTISEGHTIQRVKLQTWERVRLRNYQEYTTTATSYHAYVRPTNIENDYLREVYEAHQSLLKEVT